MSRDAEDVASMERAAASVARARAVIASAPARTTVRVRVGQREVTCRVTPRDVDASPELPVTTAAYRAVARDIALDRAIQRLYGRGAFWRADAGVRGFGQVFRSVARRDGGGASAVTGRVRIEVEVLS